jgi:hypothetical protein
MKTYVWNEKYKRYFAKNSEGYRLWQEGEDAKLKALVKKVDAELDALLRK